MCQCGARAALVRCVALLGRLGCLGIKRTCLIDHYDLCVCTTLDAKNVGCTQAVEEYVTASQLEAASACSASSDQAELLQQMGESTDALPDLSAIPVSNPARPPRRSALSHVSFIFVFFALSSNFVLCIHAIS